MYLRGTIELLEAERSVHDVKYADNQAHKNCLPNFDRAIEKLKAELAKLDEQNAVMQQD
jgi:hypothetical protein